MTFFTDSGGNLYGGGTFSIAKKSISTQILLIVRHAFTEFVIIMAIIIENTQIKLLLVND